MEAGPGGTLFFISGILYLLNLSLTVMISRAPAPAVPEFAASSSPPEDGPAILNRLRPWVITAVVFLVFAYGPTLARLVGTSQLNAPGLRVW
jgi:hypothetical protein